MAAQRAVRPLRGIDLERHVARFEPVLGHGDQRAERMTADQLVQHLGAGLFEVPRNVHRRRLAPQRLSVYSALQYGHFAQPVFSIGRYTRGCEFHRCMPGIGQDSGRSLRRHRVLVLGVRLDELRGGFGRGHGRRSSICGRSWAAIIADRPPRA